MVSSMWIFAQTAGIMAVFYKIAGVIYERTLACGEVIMYRSSDEFFHQQDTNPAKYAYSTADLIGPTVSSVTEYLAIFFTIVILGISFHTDSPEVLNNYGGFYTPLIFASYLVFLVGFVAVIFLYCNIAEESEDYLFIMNSGRMQLTLLFLFLIPVGYIFPSLLFARRFSAGESGFS